MVSIRFQNPTQGPLMTISFEEGDGPTLALVPLAASSAPADIAASSAATAAGGALGGSGTAGTVGSVSFAGPLAIAAICSGDSSPRPSMFKVAAQPLRGVSRFRSAVASTQRADADTRPVSEAVDLPGEKTQSTTTAADVTSPIDWAALLAADLTAFFKLAYEYIDELKREILRRLDRGESSESIIAWIKSDIEPELDRIEGYTANLPNDRFFSIKHDLAHKLQDVIQLVPIYLDSGDIAIAREFCRTDLQDMESIVSQLRLTFLGKVIIQKGNGLVDFLVRSPEEAQLMLRILENLVRNAADHPQEGKLPAVIIERDGARLLVRDKAAGMDAATVRKIRDGVRIHDGKEVTPDTETQETKGHGFGWQSIREVSKDLGIQWQIDSEPGVGTTVILTTPDGFFIPL